jgi:hypothetical protein
MTHTRTLISHLRRTGKRALAVALIGLVVGLLAVPQTSLAASRPSASQRVIGSGVHVVLPADGVGDSPIMP